MRPVPDHGAIPTSPASHTQYCRRLALCLPRRAGAARRHVRHTGAVRPRTAAYTLWPARRTIPPRMSVKAEAPRLRGTFCFCAGARLSCRARRRLADNRAPKRCVPPRCESAGGPRAGDDATRRRPNRIWIIRILAERTPLRCSGLWFGMVRHHKIIKNGYPCPGVPAATRPACAPLWRRRIRASACRSSS